MTTDASTPRPRSDARIYKAITEMEHRLMERLDQGIKDVKELVQERKLELGELESELRHHTALEGHPLLEVRVKNLEHEVQNIRHRPLQNWQVISVIVFIFFNFISIVLSLVYDLHIFLGH